MNKALPRFALLLALGTVIAGCATSASSPRSSQSIYRQQGARTLLSDARDMQRKGNNSAAILRLCEVRDRYPETREASEANYWLGVAYGEVESHRDAIESLRAYLRAEPDGRYADDARPLLQSFSREYDRRFPSPDKLDADISALRAELSRSPGSPQLKRTLADKLWSRGHYDEAGGLYVELSRADTSFQKDPVFIQRIEMRRDGSHIVLDPAELIRRNIEANPVSIINTSSFRSGRDRRTQVPRFFVVSGQALNRSQSVLYGVEVRCTIYGFGGAQVYDVSNQRIGRLNPGESRAFSMRFQNFRDLNNIERYECTAVFQR